MSTKIFNGYKLAHKNPFQLHADFRAVFKPAWDKVIVNEYIKGAITYADQYYFGDPNTVKEVNESIKKNDKKLLDKLGEVIPEKVTFENILKVYRWTKSAAFVNKDDKGYTDKIQPPELVVGQVPHTGEVLAFFFGDNIFEELLPEIGLTFFGYWNNTDRPKEITKEQWDNRRQMWDDAFYGGNETPITSGLSMKIVGEYQASVFYASSIAKNIDEATLPSLKERINWLASLSAGNDYVKTLQDTGQTFSMSDYSQYVHENKKKFTETIKEKITEYDYEKDIKPLL